ncbi:MAG TPA: NUMOD4 motif-containing HNH endonuclease [Gemmatimonadaceae bacterium]|nr:NUMOD4 motif-containing HNH endonuclease [Gemmatimonadaceae bacterium]
MREECTPEVWAPVKGWSGYEVSDHGRVRSWKVSRREPGASLPRILVPYSLPSGYLCVKLKDRSSRANAYVHHLVAAAFIGPRPDGHEVAHNDGSAANNLARNLRYATPKENTADQVAHGTRAWGERQWQATLTDREAALIRSHAGSHADAARAFGVSYHKAYCIRTGRTWGHL